MPNGIFVYDLPRTWGERLQEEVPIVERDAAREANIDGTGGLFILKGDRALS